VTDIWYSVTGTVIGFLNYEFGGHPEYDMLVIRTETGLALRWTGHDFGIVKRAASLVADDDDVIPGDEVEFSTCKREQDSYTESVSGADR
jgi:hypothetical protein